MQRFKQAHGRAAFAAGTFGVILIFACAALTVLGSQRLTQANVYTNGVEIRGVGSCGTNETYRFGRTLRFSTHRCYLTSDPPGAVNYWYAGRGYISRNMGSYNITRYNLRLVEFDVVERVHPYVDRNAATESTNIRVFTDYIIHIPRTSFFSSSQ